MGGYAIWLVIYLCGPYRTDQTGQTDHRQVESAEDLAVEGVPVLVHKQRVIDHPISKTTCDGIVTQIYR